MDEAKQLAVRITELIFSKKGYDVVMLDLRNLASFTDYFIICTADSDTQVRAIADEIDRILRDEGIRSWHKEGARVSTWILLDYVDVVVHVFRKDAREFYNLEKLWGDAPLTKVEDPLLVKAAVKKTKKETAPKTAKKEVAPKEEGIEPEKKKRGRPKKVKDESAAEEAPVKKVRAIKKAGNEN